MVEQPMHFKVNTHDPADMASRPWTSGLRIAVATILNALGDGNRRDRILQLYPQFQPNHFKELLAYACAELAWTPAASGTTRPQELARWREAAAAASTGVRNDESPWCRSRSQGCSPPARR